MLMQLIGQLQEKLQREQVKASLVQMKIVREDSL